MFLTGDNRVNRESLCYLRCLLFGKVFSVFSVIISVARKEVES